MGISDIHGSFFPFVSLVKPIETTPASIALAVYSLKLATPTRAYASGSRASKPVATNERSTHGDLCCCSSSTRLVNSAGSIANGTNVNGNGEADVGWRVGEWPSVEGEEVSCWLLVVSTLRLEGEAEMDFWGSGASIIGISDGTAQDGVSSRVADASSGESVGE